MEWRLESVGMVVLMLSGSIIAQGCQLGLMESDAFHETVKA